MFRKLVKIFAFVMCFFILAGCNAQKTSGEIIQENNLAYQEVVEEIVETYPKLNASSVSVKPLETSTEPTEPPFVSSDASITFSYEHVSDGDVMPYGLFTPSTAESNEKTPLIVWLHGSGECGVSKDTFSNRGLPRVLNNWELNGFNAYVLCPQLADDFNTSAWKTDTATENLNSLINKFRLEYRIDEERIILCGHSLGAQGTTYIANKLSDLFSCIVPLSGYDCGKDLSNISIPVLGYVGTPASGEDKTSYRYMMGKFSETFPDADIFVLECSHGDLPKIAFNLDDNGDGSSDLIEWMLGNRREIIGVG